MKFDREKYLSYCFDTVKRLMDVPSPSGYSREIASLLADIASEQELGFEATKKSCFLMTYEGKSHESSLGVAAHCDTLGAMVRSIDGNGNLNFAPVGGVLCNSLDGEYCFVITREGKRYTGTILSRSPSVHVYSDARSRSRDADNMYVRLDENVKSAADTRALGIENGDYICFDPKTVVTESGYLKSRFIDDKASVACILTAFKIMKDAGIVPEKDIKFLVSMYEEVGHGAAFVPANLESMLAVDMGCIGKDLKCDEHTLSICAKDAGGPYDYELTSKLIDMAKAAELPYCVDLYPYYGSDVGAMWRAGHDVPGALIGPGVHASHGMERTHADALLATVELILMYLGV
jgi:putative aminopeptidase FrvX